MSVTERFPKCQHPLRACLEIGFYCGRLQISWAVSSIQNLINIALLRLRRFWTCLLAHEILSA